MKIKKIIFFLLLILETSILLTCIDSGVGIAPSGAYSYISYDSSGAPIVKGWFTMNITDSVSISGEWHFKKIGKPKDIGPQIGDGVLIGGLKQDFVWIELNPQYIDNNLLLTGMIEDSNYRGEWTWISYAGPTNRGTFKAIKN